MNTSDRRSFHVEGLGHGRNPIPDVSRVGPLIATGGVRGIDRTTGDMSDDAEAQADRMFANLAAVVEAAGGTIRTILKITVQLKDSSSRSALNRAWERAFPDPDSRPARQVMIYEALGGKILLQCDALALTTQSLEPQS